jgi:hypothetical protein
VRDEEASCEHEKIALHNGNFLSVIFISMKP